jgi:hypothetical protein
MIRFRFLQIQMSVLRVIVVPMGWLFWRLEQARTRLQTKFDNERAARERR